MKNRKFILIGLWIALSIECKAQTITFSETDTLIALNANREQDLINER